MGIRDEASLSARERAALAHLEARAAADDPHLARRLRGDRRQLRLVIPAVPTWSGPAWWSIPLIVAGLVLAVLGTGTVMALALLGIAVEAVGLWMIAGIVERRYRRRLRPD